MFLPKAAALTSPNGHISMLQPSGLLTNAMGTAARFRERFFDSFQVHDITNLATLRFGLYKGAIGPSCVVTFSPRGPDGSPFQYVVPKELKTIDDDLRIVIEPSDINLIYPEDAAHDRTIWATLAWGGAREQAMIRRLRSCETLRTLASKKLLKKRRGIVRTDKRREDREIVAQNPGGHKLSARHIPVPGRE